MTNRIHNLLDKASTNKPNTLALIDPQDQQVTWQTLARMTEGAYQQLQVFGVRPGDRVLLAFENCPAVIAFLFAASRLDAIVVPVNARLAQAELTRIIEHSDPAVLVFSTGTSPAAVEHAESFGAKTVTGAFGEAGLLARTGSTQEPVFGGAAEQVAVLMYTSGTTGSPKAAMLTHGNLISAAHASAEVRGMQASDMCFLALPISHIYGLVTLMAICLKQAKMRLEAGFSVERLYKALLTDVTLLPGVPQMHAHLFHYARMQNKPGYDHGLLRMVSSGGAPLDPAWKKEAEAFYGLPLQNGYGLTEGAAGVCATVNEAVGDPDTSVGYAMGDCLLKLDMDAFGSTPEEGIGEILVAGPQIMKGYFRDQQQTARAITPDGYFRTGDLGYFDDTGRLHISGRSKELIIRSGFNVYPVEIEASLTEHPEVIVAGVVGRSVAGNEEVLGFVKVAGSCELTEADFKAFVHDKLAPYKRPSRIIVATELPTAPTGKILKSKLPETFAAELR